MKKIIITEQQLDGIIIEQDAWGYSSDKINRVLVTAREDLNTTKKYFAKLLNIVSVMTISSVNDTTNDMIEQARKNLAAVRQKSENYFDVVNSFEDTTPVVRELDDIATELDDYAMVINYAIEVMDELMYGAKMLKEYL